MRLSRPPRLRLHLQRARALTATAGAMAAARAMALAPLDQTAVGAAGVMPGPIDPANCPEATAPRTRRWTHGPRADRPQPPAPRRPHAERAVKDARPATPASAQVVDAETRQTQPLR